jgi:hypothetical protein
MHNRLMWWWKIAVPSAGHASLVEFQRWSRFRSWLDRIERGRAAGSDVDFVAPL